MADIDGRSSTAPHDMLGGTVRTRKATTASMLAITSSNRNIQSARFNTATTPKSRFAPHLDHARRKAYSFL